MTEAPDLTKPPNKAWPVQMFYGAESERKFRDLISVKADDWRASHVLSDIAYVGPKFVMFRMGEEVRALPLSGVIFIIHHPNKWEREGGSAG